MIFKTPIQYDYEASVEVRSLLSTERLEEMDGRLAVTDEDPHAPGVRYVKFWVDEAPSDPEGGRSHADEEVPFPLASARDLSRAPMTPERRYRMPSDQEVPNRNHSHGVQILVGEWGTAMMITTIGDTSPRAIEHQHERQLHPESHQRTTLRGVAPCSLWNP